MNRNSSYLINLLLWPWAALVSSSAFAQQFNSDNYLAMPHGTVTMITVAGTEYSTLGMSYALFPRWEFFVGGFLSWEDPTDRRKSHFSVTNYAKYMFYENDTKNGGLALAGGSGNYPGYLEKDRLAQSYRTYWLMPQLSIPLLDGRLLWDLNPGVTLNADYGESREKRFGVTYSTRAALYKIIPKSAIVGEVFGVEGGAHTPMQYRIGVRWEPSSTFVGALTWSAGFDGSTGGGVELGIMIFTPQFLCFGTCKTSEGTEGSK